MTSEVKAPVGQLARSADELSRSADETRERLSRRDDRFRGVEGLLSAASGLARTIAATEELAQQRAELVRTRRALGGPRPDGNGGPMISLSDAARRSGRHPEVLRRWCAEGRIPAVRIGRTWAIAPETLRLLVEHSARSRPRLPISGSA